MNSPLKRKYLGARYAKAWTYMVRNKRLSMGCRFLLVVLRTYCSRHGAQCWPSEERLAEDIGKTSRHVRRWIQEAIKAGVLSKKPRFPGERKGVLYTLLDEDEAYRLQLIALPKGHKRTQVSKTIRTQVSTDQDVLEQGSEKVIPIRCRA